jgi:hypothetical protein
MYRRLLRWLAPLFLTACWLSPAPAQQAPVPSGQPTVPDAEKAERGPPALQYAFAILCTILVLLIVCMPSRKS